MEKDKTEVGITGQPVPKPKTARQQHELEKKRRMRKHLGRNVGGTQYSSDVNPYLNPRSVREEVLSYLLDEGFATDEKSAEAIMGAMSEAWIESILEVVTTTGEKAPKAVPSQMFPGRPFMGANRPYQDPFINPSGERGPVDRSLFKGASKPVKKDTKTA
jgi:hypothetical protein